MDWTLVGCAAPLALVLAIAIYDGLTRTEFDYRDEAICDLWKAGRITREEADRLAAENNERARAAS